MIYIFLIVLMIFISLITLRSSPATWPVHNRTNYYIQSGYVIGSWPNPVEPPDWSSFKNTKINQDQIQRFSKPNCNFWIERWEWNNWWTRRAMVGNIQATRIEIHKTIFDWDYAFQWYPYPQSHILFSFLAYPPPGLQQVKTHTV